VEIAVSEAKGQLTDLLRRAEAGEEIILTRHGRPAGKIVPVGRRRLSPNERLEVIRRIQLEAAEKVTPGLEPLSKHDYLYDEHGLPK
jgi:prevent-host-death family protein